MRSINFFFSCVVRLEVSVQQMFLYFATWPTKTTECTCETHTKLNTYARVKRFGFSRNENAILHSSCENIKIKLGSHIHIHSWVIVLVLLQMSRLDLGAKNFATGFP